MVPESYWDQQKFAMLRVPVRKTHKNALWSCEGEEMKSKLQSPSHDFGDAGITDFPSGNALGMECSQCQSYFYVLQVAES